jgi:hypothetical protein
MADSGSNGRPYRSKSQRPCDRCRRRKTVCLLEAEGPCQSCVKAHQACTFDMPPTKRHRDSDSSVSRPAPSRRTPDGMRDSSIEHHVFDAASMRQSRIERRYSQTQDNTFRRSRMRIGGETEQNANAPLPKSDEAIIDHLSPMARRRENHSQHTPQAPSEFNTVSPLNQIGLPQTVQYVCSLDQISGATAQLCGISAELDPWLLRHCKYDEYGMRRLQNIHIRNVGGVPIRRLVPVHFTVADDHLLEPAQTGMSPDERAYKRHELERLVPPEHGTRLLSLSVWHHSLIL